MKKFQFQWLDVWGNDKEGYEVNDVRETGVFILSEDLPCFKTIVKIAKLSNLIKKRVRSYASQYPYESMEVIEYKGMPLYQVVEYEGEGDSSSWFFETAFKAEPARVYKVKNDRVYKVR